VGEETFFKVFLGMMITAVLSAIFMVYVGITAENTMRIKCAAHNGVFIYGYCFEDFQCNVQEGLSIALCSTKK
jgi:hypothetical protein